MPVVRVDSPTDSGRGGPAFERDGPVCDGDEPTFQRDDPMCDRDGPAFERGGLTCDRDDPTFDTLLSRPAKAARMLERDRIIEAVAAVAVVLAMLATMAWIGFSYGSDSALGDEGVDLMIATIVGFILLVTALGVALAFVLSDPTPPDADDDEGDAGAEADASA